MLDYLDDPEEMSGYIAAEANHTEDTESQKRIGHVL